MNHNMRKMYTEQEVIDLIQQNNHIYLISCCLIDTDGKPLTPISELINFTDTTTEIKFSVLRISDSEYVNILLEKQIDGSWIMDSDNIVSEGSVDLINISNPSDRIAIWEQ